MDKQQFKNRVDELFANINDIYDVDYILTSLADNCRKIAEHICCNWSDSILADQWNAHAEEIDKVELLA